MNILARARPLGRRCHARIGLAWLCLATAVALIPAKADLVLDNYSAANPIKIMAIGDSITDDCSINGAWRQYLQPLLETNGYPFLFVGRQASTPSGAFTKIFHEGYCGAVIAAPGVMTSAVHGYPGTNVCLQKIVPDALTNIIPDLILLVIGVNDIGRGRDPSQVATNDMPMLLDTIFSNAPNVNIILAKVTSLTGANISGLSYATNATNIYMYNAALQKMVNERRALGQNVFLADMFSAVDPNTMFSGDHVHPNSSGLQAMAREWLARIQTITLTSNRVASTLIHGGEVWKYSDTGQDLGTNWAQHNYDDSGWNSGPARLGYGDRTVVTAVSYGASSTNRNRTTYFRHWFSVPAEATLTNLNFRLLRVDGAVVWLNGHEVFRTNMPAGPISYTNLASQYAWFDAANTFYPTNLPGAILLPGRNLVAVEVHLYLPARNTLGFDLELLGAGYYLPPTLAISRSGGALAVSWPTAHSTGYSLYSTTNLANPDSWSVAAGSVTNGGNVVVTQSPDTGARFYRLRRP